MQAQTPWRCCQNTTFCLQKPRHGVTKNCDCACAILQAKTQPFLQNLASRLVQVWAKTNSTRKNPTTGCGNCLANNKNKCKFCPKARHANACTTHKQGRPCQLNFQTTIFAKSRHTCAKKRCTAWVHLVFEKFYLFFFAGVFFVFSDCCFSAYKGNVQCLEFLACFLFCFKIFSSFATVYPCAKT